MRVADRRTRRDDGAVLLIFAAFTVVAVLFLAFVVDLGAQRENRRELTTSTDAAALDVAQQWAATSLSTTLWPTVGANLYNCTAAAQATARANNDGLDPDALQCVAEKRTTYGVVTVGMSEAVDFAFGGVTGVDSGGTNSSTSVRITGPAQGGLRPFALCMDEPQIKAWLAAGSADPLVVDAVKFLPDFCGTSSGSWGLMDLGGGGASKVGNVFANGYGSPVQVSPNPEACLVTTPASCFEVATGVKFNSNNLKTPLDFLAGPAGCAEGGIEFTLPTYKKVIDPGGKKAKFPISGFARVQLMCFEVSGANLNRFELKLLGFETEGTCCSGISAINRVLEICDVGTVGGAVGPKFGTGCNAAPPVVPPVVVDGCDIVSITPATQNVTVTGAGASTAVANATVTVADHTKCGAISLRAFRTTPVAQSIPANAGARSGNTYPFTFANPTTFAAHGATYILEAADDGVAQAEEAELRTVADGTPPATCKLTSVSTSGALPQIKKGPGSSGPTKELTSALNVTAGASGGASCSGVVVTVTVKNPAGETRSDVSAECKLNASGTCSASFPAANITKPPKFDWVAGVYEVAATSIAGAAGPVQFSLVNQP